MIFEAYWSSVAFAHVDAARSTENQTRYRYPSIQLQQGNSSSLLSGHAQGNTLQFDYSGKHEKSDANFKQSFVFARQNQVLENQTYVGPSDYSYLTNESFLPNDFHYHNIRGDHPRNVLDISGTKTQKLCLDATPNFRIASVADPIWQIPMYLNRDDSSCLGKNGIFVDPNHPPQNSSRNQEIVKQDTEDSNSKVFFLPSQRLSDDKLVNQDNRGRPWFSKAVYMMTTYRYYIRSSDIG